MKKSYFIAFIIIATAVSIIVFTSGSTSSYATFQEAHEKFQYNQAKEVHIVGELKKNNEGHVEGIKIGEDRVSFSFMMIDENNQEERVWCTEPMPHDFTRSEKIVVVGAYHKEIFVAKKILLKCPSKYKKNNLEVDMNI